MSIYYTIRTMTGPSRTSIQSALSVDEVVAVVRRHAGVSGKGAIAQVAGFVDAGDPLHGPGDAKAKRLAGLLGVAGEAAGIGEYIFPIGFGLGRGG